MAVLKSVAAYEFYRRHLPHAASSRRRWPSCWSSTRTIRARIRFSVDDAADGPARDQRRRAPDGYANEAERLTGGLHDALTLRPHRRHLRPRPASVPDRGAAAPAAPSARSIARTYFYYAVTVHEPPTPAPRDRVRVRRARCRRATTRCISGRSTTSGRAASSSGCTTRPAVASPAAHRDYFGNWVHRFNVLARAPPAPHRGRVGGDAARAAAAARRRADASRRSTRSATALLDEYYDFLVPVESTCRSPRRSPSSSRAAEDGERRHGRRLGRARPRPSSTTHFRYEKGATHVHSVGRDVLTARRGRLPGLRAPAARRSRARGGCPARYVSGYLVPPAGARGPESVEQVIGGQASHAWAEVFMPGSGWLGLDPTLGRADVGTRHVRVAYGRDYGDVAAGARRLQRARRPAPLGRRPGPAGARRRGRRAPARERPRAGRAAAGGGTPAATAVAHPR